MGFRSRLERMYVGSHSPLMSVITFLAWVVIAATWAVVVPVLDIVNGWALMGAFSPARGSSLKNGGLSHAPHGL